MPVFLTGGDPHDVAGSNLLDRVTPSLYAAGTGRDDQDLTSGMRVPRRAGTGLERDRPATGMRRVERFEQHFDTNLTREVRRRPRPDARDPPRVMITVWASIDAEASRADTVSVAVKRIIVCVPPMTGYHSINRRPRAASRSSLAAGGLASDAHGDSPKGRRFQLPSVADADQAIAAVVADQDRAVRHLQHVDRAAEAALPAPRPPAAPDPVPGRKPSTRGS